MENSHFGSASWRCHSSYVMIKNTVYCTYHPRDQTIRFPDRWILHEIKLLSTYQIELLSELLVNKEVVVERMVVERRVEREWQLNKGEKIRILAWHLGILVVTCVRMEATVIVHLSTHNQIIRSSLFLSDRQYALAQLCSTYQTSSPLVPTARRVVGKSIAPSMFKTLCVVGNGSVDVTSKSFISYYQSIMI